MLHKLDQRNPIEFFERQDDSSNYDLDAVPVPPNVLDNEIEWETTHPSKGGKDVRQTGNLDPPANTCLNVKVVYNSRWMSHFNGDQAAAATGARAHTGQAEQAQRGERVDRFSSYWGVKSPCPRTPLGRRRKPDPRSVYPSSPYVRRQASHSNTLWPSFIN